MIQIKTEVTWFTSGNIRGVQKTVTFFWIHVPLEEAVIVLPASGTRLWEAVFPSDCHPLSSHSTSFLKLVINLISFSLVLWLRGLSVTLTRLSTLCRKSRLVTLQDPQAQVWRTLSKHRTKIGAHFCLLAESRFPSLSNWGSMGVWFISGGSKGLWEKSQADLKARLPFSKQFSYKERA